MFSTLHRATRVIIGVWICAFLAALPVGWIVVLTRLELPENMNSTNIGKVSFDQKTIADTESCGMDPNKQPEQKRIIIYTFIFFFLLPALLISLVYFHIVIRLREGNGYLSAQSNGHSHGVKSRKAVLKILVAVVIMFFICWFPFHLQRLITIFLNESTLQTGEFASLVNWMYHVSFYVSGYCYYSNSACNPILYNILSEKYRIAFLRTICGDRVTEKLIRRSTTKSKRHTNASFTNNHLPSTPQTAKSSIQIQPGGKEIIKKMPYLSNSIKGKGNASPLMRMPSQSSEG
uniref:G_PROTEIN_RECEP_F1_2 domain-containing protein n=1 Tax=Panagrellus redivivus TaxID=6233 RepID=A0A7E4W5N3_PANRE